MDFEFHFTGYGRESRGKVWYIHPLVGVNRFWYIRSGEVRFRVGERVRTLRAGRLYIFPQNLPFYLLTDDSTWVDHTYFDFFSLPALMMDDVLEIDPKQYPLIASAMDILLALAEEKQRGGNYRVLLSSYMSNLFYIIRREIGFGVLDDALIHEAVSYIHAHFHEKISVGEMAKRFHIEKNVFIRKFKRCTGTTPYQYIKNHRVTYAVSLIRQGKISLAEVAELTGYADQSALSHAVKAVWGKSPEHILFEDKEDKI